MIEDPATGALASDGSGNVFGTLYTRSSFVGYNDDVDRETFLSWKTGVRTGGALETDLVWPLQVTQIQQQRLYRAAIFSRDINNSGMEDTDIGWYMLFLNNCGSWARHMIESNGLTWPRNASYLNSGGAGIGGILDASGVSWLVTKKLFDLGNILDPMPIEEDDFLQDTECNLLGACVTTPSSAP